MTRDGQILSHARLRRNIAILAQRLTNAGLAPGQTFIVLDENRDLQIMARFAALLVGAEVVMSPGPKGFLGTGTQIDRALVPPGRAHGPGTPIAFDPAWFADDAPVPDTAWRGGGGMHFSSSGSTGEQKFMRLSDEGMAHWMGLIEGHIGPDRGPRLLTLPAFSAFGLFQLTKALMAGQSVMGTMDGVAETLAQSHRLGVREMVLTPPILADVLAAIADGSPAPDIVRIVFGGAIADPGLLRRAREVFPAAELVVVFGATEIGLVACGRWPDEGAPMGWGGWLLPGIEARLADAGTFADYPAEAGRLGFRVPPVARALGYLGRGPAFDPDGWFDTGDIATIAPDGALVILGREDFLINLGGVKTTPEAIEALCLGQPGVAQVAATRVPGKAHDRLGLMVAPGRGFDASRLRAAVAARLDIALTIEVREVEALPRLPSGKIDRAAVARAFAHV
ncbi:class I adenylate-forming enzyme family protein [Limimaricola sp.]|uniref:class I adenylate-forming enzyme family protein n=1 Tax=Limimaricola sp. TaxID=2211665 RepID=UPI0025BE4343|nr:class I adenylate-forming enzyme family protein [Limimaricola sp.]